MPPPSRTPKKANPRGPTADLAFLDQCVLFDVHRVSRVLTALYNSHLREAGVTVTQFTLLQSINAIAPAGITRVAESMVMDRTSVTRLIEPLLAQGFLATEPGEDRRFRNLVVTKEGKKAIARAEPAWRAAQAELHSRVGTTQWLHMRDALRTTLKLMRQDNGPANPEAAE
ncbi:MarR family winged helix-turn-helix transcriptional regulator [Burkholderia lata]|uniref:MarR family winged helix-turn-helix transcriptional regulator n=1 Tax=Burkholderia lata (strain ATCC 17760 / DSM 23089 / LMG 22485 / NCIMB 9086 / R18194 / 383) TaxID=482957 RepID=UPI0020C627E9|nr:MarR family winged helix-turn-helix transcriptional regulator [Burkholderia lata]